MKQNLLNKTERNNRLQFEYEFICFTPSHNAINLEATSFIKTHYVITSIFSLKIQRYKYFNVHTGCCLLPTFVDVYYKYETL